MKKNRYIALLAGLSLALMSSPALAYPSADTLLVSGYDAEGGVVLYGVSSIDQEDDDATLDCSLDGDYVYSVGGEDLDEDDDFETREVTNLSEYDSEAEEPGDEVTFESEDEDSTDAPVEYSNLDADECGLTAVTIEHPGDGEINHGTIVSTFARLLQGGNGCLIRLFAQSDYGKGDYNAEAEADFLVTLSSHETACKKGPGAAFQAQGDDDDSSRGGPPPWAGPDRDPSADKPGKGNKPAHAGDDSGS